MWPLSLFSLPADCFDVVQPCTRSWWLAQKAWSFSSIFTAVFVFCSELCGAGASRISFLVRSPDVNWGASLSVTSGSCWECTISGSLSHTRFSVSAEHTRVFLCASQIQKWWASETHFPNAGSFTKTLPVLYPASALGHNQRGLCWWAQGGVIMLMLSCSWYPPLRALKPFCSVPGLQNSVWEPGQHPTAPDLPACRALR